jgi:hypothetical protein
MSNGDSFFQQAINHPEISVPATIATAAAIAAAVWAFKGEGVNVAERAAALVKGEEVSPFISLGGAEPRLADWAGLQGGASKSAAGLRSGDLPFEEALDAHAASWIFHEPEDAGFAQALAFALEHDRRLGELAAGASRSVGRFSI